MSKREKITWMAQNILYTNPIDLAKDFAQFWHDNVEHQKVFEGFSENTISNFHLPFGVAPNFVINGKDYAIPMVIEESSVVAACSHAAKFWAERGGFKTTIINTTKVGHVHFLFEGAPHDMEAAFQRMRPALLEAVKDLTANMEKRGGGIKDLFLNDKTSDIPNYYQLEGHFDTVDSMGANFINSILENWSEVLVHAIQEDSLLDKTSRNVEVVMSILSNYTPDCRVRAEVSCPVDDLGHFKQGEISPEQFAKRFAYAVAMAECDPYRATTHNKGIMNGIDAVILATGNDFRAVEAGAHAYAAKDGQYKSLTHCSVEDGQFRFFIELPLAIGTVGGLTKLHPLAKKSLEILGQPSAEELMQIVATVGLAQNFGAVKALTTSGIQAGHMKMHLTNILNSLKATTQQTEAAVEYFQDKVVSYSAVRAYLLEHGNG